MNIKHNLPNRPYGKFFGREESITKIKENLIDGGTFIASIDGIGGIGKTALAYNFCENFLIPSKRFKHIIWITSKKTVFDPFSKEMMIKQIQNDFYGVESLIDITLKVTGFEEIIGEELKYKVNFFEDIVSSESLFFVLDNLETIEDEDFFSYLTKDFNRLSGINRNFKVLTTSRKRKKIIDFPIEISGLSIEDALSMLKFLAVKFNIKSILHSSDFQNVKLLERVGNIPLGIEFIVGQISLGKSLGQVFKELEGYPSLDDLVDEDEKKKRLSDIILFSFKDMYETLDYPHQHIFKTVAALQKNRRSNDEISFDLLMSISNYSKGDLDEILENLIDSKLIILDKDEYNISQMAVNFVRQYYDEFESFENEIVGLKTKIDRNDRNIKDKVDVFLDNVKFNLEENKYQEAEEFLLKSLDVYNDARLYYEIAKVQRVLNKFSKASDNFRLATQLAPNNVKIWYDWINMEDSRQRHNIALNLIDQALIDTNNDVSIIIQKISIYRYKKEYFRLRQEIKHHLEVYEYEQRFEDYKKLLRSWKSIEYTLTKEGSLDTYIEVAELLASKEEDKELGLQVLNELFKVLNRARASDQARRIQRKIQNLEDRIKLSMGGRIKQLNRLFNQKEYEKGKKEARRILKWFDEDTSEDNIFYYKDALRVLMQILATEEDYEKISITFDEYKIIGYGDENCRQIYEKAERMKTTLRRNIIIGDISVNIQSSEINLRQLIMWSLKFDEQVLINMISLNGKTTWLEQWRMTRNRSLKQDADLIYYSDLGHLKHILNWSIQNILDNILEIKLKQRTEQNLIKIVRYLEEWVAKERNETFHSRLQLFNLEELNEVLVDTRRLVNLTNQVKEDLNIIN